MTGRRYFLKMATPVVLMLACHILRADISYTVDPGTLLAGDVVIPAEMGVTNGSNLLHSFDQFSITSGASATFTGPNIIDNIIARVTGVTPSRIDGLLRSEIIDADLFLLNPNGIMFADGAQVDIDGSLYLSTAHTVRFEDGSLLAISDTGKSTLTTAPPRAFGPMATSGRAGATGTAAVPTSTGGLTISASRRVSRSIPRRSPRPPAATRRAKGTPK